MPKAKKAPKEITGNVEDTIKEIQTKFGEGSIMRLEKNQKYL